MRTVYQLSKYRNTLSYFLDSKKYKREKQRPSHIEEDDTPD